MRRTWAFLAVLLFDLAMGGCSTFETPRYVKSPGTAVLLMKSVVTGVGVGAFAGPEDFDTQCRAAGPLRLPDGISHTEYIKKALEEELKAAGVFQSDKPRVILAGTVNRLEFSSARGLGGGSWDIEITLSSSNGRSLRASESYVFESGFRGRKACNRTAEAFMPAVQNIIRKMLSSPGFKPLVL